MIRDRRRALFLGAGAVGLAVLTTAFSPRRALAYDPLPGLAPFRALRSGGSLSGASLALAGLEPQGAVDAALTAPIEAVRGDPCRALFGDAPAVPGKLAMAYFTDVNCSNCRVLEHGLASIMARDPGLRLVRHELPLLGPASVAAAQAILAAEMQGQAETLTRRLARAGLVTDQGYLRAVAGSLGIDADRMVEDMTSPAVEARLLTTQALAQVFGLAGVPTLVVGRTLVVGAVPGDMIVQVIRDERALPDPACSTG